MSLTKATDSDSIRKQSTFKQTVYKSAIDSPFNIKWPRVQADLSSRLLDHLLNILEPVGEYRKTIARSSSKKKGRLATTTTTTATADTPPPPPPPPELVSGQRLLVGINNVTKHLEQMIQKKKTDQGKLGAAVNNNAMDLTPAIFLCRRDIKPVHMCSHLLTMASLANVKLVPLPLASEALLAKALHLHCVSVVFLEVCDSDVEEPLRLAVNEVPAVEAPWLAGAITHHNNPYSNTRIKILKTTGTFTKKSKSS